MGVSLTKGGNVSLSKEAPGLTAIIVGLGWDTRTTDGTDFDLDASAILLNDTDKAVSDGHFVFFNNLKSPDGSVEHLVEQAVINLLRLAVAFQEDAGLR